MKCSGVDLRNCREQGGGEVELSNQFRPAETKLRVADISSGNKYRAVVDRNRDCSLSPAEWIAPERCWVKIVDEMSVLGLVQ